MTAYTYPIPMRDGKVIVQLRDVPDDLTPAEAERICALVRAIAKPEQTGQDRKRG